MLSEHQGRKQHELKVWPENFQPLWIGTKEFEVRKNDRGFQVGDSLWLREWDPKGTIRSAEEDKQRYTGRWLVKRVAYLIQGEFGLPQDICVMQLR